MELVAERDEGSRLSIQLCREPLLALLAYLSKGLLAWVMVVTGIKLWIDPDVFSQSQWPELLILMVLPLYVLSQMVPVVGLLYYGERYTFDKSLGLILHNGSKVALLSDLQEVEFTFGAIPTMWRSGRSKQWQRIALVLHEGGKVTMLRTNMFAGLSNADPRVPDHKALRQQAARLAHRVADFASVRVLEHEVDTRTR